MSSCVSSDAGCFASVDQNFSPSDGTGEIGDQEGGSVGDFLRLNHAFHGNAGRGFLPDFPEGYSPGLCCLFSKLLSPFRLCRGWGYGVDPNILFSQFPAQASGEIDEGRIGRAAWEKGRRRHPAG